MSKSILEKIQQLRDQINHHNYRYYVLSDPVITDQEYDRFMKQLEALEAENPEFITADSPTQRIGDQLNKEFPSVLHTEPMLSLSNTYSEEDMMEFDKRVRSLLPQGENYQYVVELKYDGVAVCLRYEQGTYVQGITRGNGREGDDITANLKTVRAIPLQLRKPPPALKSCEIRGEVFMRKDDFLRLNEQQEESGNKIFANPRNATSGTLKMQDPRIVARRPLSFFAYKLLPAEPVQQDYDMHYTNLQQMKEIGVPVNPINKLCRTIQEVLQFCNAWELKRDTLDYEIDGVVVKLNSISHQNRLGATAKSPRWAIAFKFKARKAETVLTEVEWQVGRTGAVTPVARMEPVPLGGITISRATLHNVDEIHRLGIRLGDTVHIERGGDVIPKITGFRSDKRSKRSELIKIPTQCPQCGSKLVRLDEEAALRCMNAACPKQVERQILHYASRNAMDIEGMGESLVRQLLSKKLVADVGDIYSLKHDAVAGLDRMAEKSAQNVLSAIKKSRNQSLDRLIFGLGIRYVGIGAARELADHYRSIGQLETAKIVDLEAVEGIGSKMADSIFRFFREPLNVKILDKLRLAGVRMERQKSPVQELQPAIAGKSFVLTGTLVHFTREKAAEKIRNAGGRVLTSVSIKTDFVVAGENPGSKLEKARNLDVPILTEREFESLFQE